MLFRVDGNHANQRARKLLQQLRGARPTDDEVHEVPQDVDVAIYRLDRHARSPEVQAALMESDALEECRRAVLKAEAETHQPFLEMMANRR